MMILQLVMPLTETVVEWGFDQGIKCLIILLVMNESTLPVWLVKGCFTLVHKKCISNVIVRMETNDCQIQGMKVGYQLLVTGGKTT